MKSLSLFKTFSLIMAVLLFVAGLGVIERAENTSSRQEPEVRAQHPAENTRFSPVRRAEREMTRRINEYRETAGVASIHPNWDLFRFARDAAEGLASGKIRKVDRLETKRWLKGLGQSPRTVQVLVARSSRSDRLPPNSWWYSPEVKVTMEAAWTEVGVGHSVKDGDQVWVALFAKQADR
ncbi:hypothetical protein EWH99_01035 [Sporolactobacillus sp. THM7-7]|nr:hypothetical protein EWH99_01035 [Sporolactobacillus sp. THM7-7]